MTCHKDSPGVGGKYELPANYFVVDVADLLAG